MDGMTPTSLARTPRLDQILATAGEIAADAGHSWVGVEHVMLAILRDSDALPTQELANHGVDVAGLDARMSDTIHGQAYQTPTNRVRGLDGQVHEPKQ